MPVAQVRTSMPQARWWTEVLSVPRRGEQEQLWEVASVASLSWLVLSVLRAHRPSCACNMYKVKEQERVEISFNFDAYVNLSQCRGATQSQSTVASKLNVGRVKGNK